MEQVVQATVTRITKNTIDFELRYAHETRPSDVSGANNMSVVCPEWWNTSRKGFGRGSFKSFDCSRTEEQ
jgi:hypothetical protein